MKRFIWKEYRTLLVPVGLLVAASLPLAVVPGRVPGWLQAPLGNLLRSSFMLAFVLGMPFIASLPLGSEFDRRTMPLLLAQPISRARLFFGKWLCGLAAACVLGAVQLAVVGAASHGAAFDWEGVTAGGTVFVMVLCSAPLWTLVARSTLGGLALTGLAVVTVEIAAGYIASRLGGGHTHPFAHLPLLDAVHAVYAAVTLWLGWRLFATFEVSAAGVGSLSIGSQTSQWAVLRPRRGTAIGNLLRKELMLQRPAFLVTGAFLGSWLAARLLVGQHVMLAEVLQMVLLAAYVPAAVLLSATVPVSEEQSLGVRPWHLAIPVAVRTQWAVKVLAALLTALTLALALPALLVGLAPIAPHLRMTSVDPLGLVLAVVLVAGASAFGIWAASLFVDTASAAAGAASAVFCLILLTTTLAAFAPNVQSAGKLFPIAVFVPVSAAALWQSLRAFGQIQVPRAAVVRMSLALAAVAVLTVVAAAVVVSR